MDNYGDKRELKRELNKPIVCVSDVGERIGIHYDDSRERKLMEFYKYKDYLLGVRNLDENMREEVEEEVTGEKIKTEVIKEVML
jgi:hypothetical protein